MESQDAKSLGVRLTQRLAERVAWMLFFMSFIKERCFQLIKDTCELSRRLEKRRGREKLPQKAGQLLETQRSAVQL